MNKNQKILNKIEEWCDKLPYITIKVEVELPDETLVFERLKPQRIIGFATSENGGENYGRK